jgi:molybdopterin adenylyltransferase
MTNPNETTKEKHTEKKTIPIRVFLLLISDSISAANDADRQKLDVSGKVAEDLVRQAGFEVIKKDVVPDEKIQIQGKILPMVEQNIELIITIGGTGVTKRDVTIEAVSKLVEKEMPGFGELFRFLTYQEVGTVSIATRAMAGIIKETVIVCLPGSPNAVKLGVPIILKEIVHFTNMLRK